MEETPASSLFTLSIDPVTKNHLLETARWARFLAIVGMLSLALMIVFGLFYSIWVSRTIDNMQNRVGFQSPKVYGSGFVAGSAFMFILMAIVGFFPLLYMFRFATQMKTALIGNDQENLNESFQNLKRYFRYLGIITIIGIGIWVIWVLVVGVAMFSLR
jgi:hypothetical protein